MRKLFIKKKIISPEVIQDILSEGEPIVLSGVYSNGKSGYKEHARSSTCIGLHPKEWPDVVNPMRDLMKLFDPFGYSEAYDVMENMEYLKYDLNGRFTKHKDKIDKPNKDNTPRIERIYSTTTILSKTDDLKGGDFIIYDKSGHPTKVDLDIGDTVMFDSLTDHEVTNINSGIRKSLVVWIHKI